MAAALLATAAGLGSAPGKLPAIVFVSRAPLADGSLPGLGPGGRARAPGGRLLVREPDGELRPLLPEGALFDASDPCVSWDGTRVVFSGTTSPDSAWRIWVVGADGSGLRPLTTTDRRVPPGAFLAARFAPHDDLDPCWLPDGRVLFASTRWPQAAQRDGSPVTNLFVTDLEGGPPERLTSERNGGEEPSIDPVTGRVLYTRWWTNRWLATDFDSLGATLDAGRAAPHDTVDQWVAASVAPDGDDVQLGGGDPRARRTLTAYQPVRLASGSLAAVTAARPSLVPFPGRTGVRVFAGGLGPAHPIAGWESAIGGTACSPAALPDGRVAFAWAPAGSRDLGLYVATESGDRLAPIVDLPGTLELDPAVLAVRPRPPRIEPQAAGAASLLALTSPAQLSRDATNTFRFDCLNVFANAAVDAPIPDAVPFTRGVRIRFYSVVARPGQAGGDSLVLLREEPVTPSGAVHVDGMIADVPLFEQLVDAEGRVLRSGSGPAHVPGFNFARMGTGTRCVGCHRGHSRIPVPESYWRGKWTNAAPSARVLVSSTGAGAARGAVDRRARGDVEEVGWIAAGRRGEWLQLSWDLPIEARAVVLYPVREAPSQGTRLHVREAEIAFLRGGREVKRLGLHRTLEPGGTRVAFEPVRVDAVRIALVRVEGRVLGRAAAALAEVEVEARIVEE